MPDYRYGRYLTFTPGDFISRVRLCLQTIINNDYQPGDGNIDPFFELTTFDVYRSVKLIFGQTTAGFRYYMEVVLASLGAEEDSPARWFVDSQGWLSPFKLRPFSTFYTGAIDPIVDMMALEHGVRTSVLEEWGRCTFRRTNLDGTDTTVTPLVHSYTRTTVFDAIGEQIIDVSRCVVFDSVGFPGSLDENDAPALWSDVDPAATVPCSASVILDTASVAAAIRDSSREDITASFDNGRVTVHIGTGDIVEEP